jgi:SAM-dependent methyltransferase
VPTEQAQLNEAIWRRGEYVAEYANRRLIPAEVLILARYRDQLSKRVLEVGCGAGRVLGYLVALGGEVHGIDISDEMVEHCRRAYPAAHVAVGDLAHIEDAATGPFDAIVAADNVIDVFDDAERRRVLADLRALLTPDGLLIFSAHNLEYVDGPGDARPRATPTGGRGRRIGQLLSKAASRPLADVAGYAMRLPRRIRNRRRLAKLERRAADHAILNDEAHDYALLHYYIRRDDQERQLAQLGYELVECLDADGSPVGQGQGSPSPWLHYVARPAGGDGAPGPGDPTG